MGSYSGHEANLATWLSVCCSTLSAECTVDSFGARALQGLPPSHTAATATSVEQLRGQDWVNGLYAWNLRHPSYLRMPSIPAVSSSEVKYFTTSAVSLAPTACPAWHVSALQEPHGSNSGNFDGNRTLPSDVHMPLRTFCRILQAISAVAGNPLHVSVYS